MAVTRRKFSFTALGLHFITAPDCLECWIFYFTGNAVEIIRKLFSFFPFEHIGAGVCKHWYIKKEIRHFPLIAIFFGSFWCSIPILVLNGNGCLSWSLGAVILKSFPWIDHRSSTMSLSFYIIQGFLSYLISQTHTHMVSQIPPVQDPPIYVQCLWWSWCHKLQLLLRQKLPVDKVVGSWLFSLLPIGIVTTFLPSDLRKYFK